MTIDPTGQRGNFEIALIGVLTLLGIVLVIAVLWEEDRPTYVDTETGCEYLATWEARALTPRLDREGVHICRGGEER